MKAEEKPTVACYVHWRDAAMHMDETDIEEMSLVDLYEVGWLIRETDEHITLAIEYPGGRRSTRLALSIPKVNIVQRHDFGMPKERKPRAARKPKALPVTELTHSSNCATVSGRECDCQER